jgi:hypothetical protein
VWIRYERSNGLRRRQRESAAYIASHTHRQQGKPGYPRPGLELPARH